MRTYHFTPSERAYQRKVIKKAMVTLCGKDSYRQMVARKWELRNIERITKGGGHE